MMLLSAMFIAAATLTVAARAAAADPAQKVLDSFSNAWRALKTYECTIASHEVRGKRVQERVYLIRFSKPLETRIDITAGDGRGSAAVWDGGDRVRGHQGGILALIELNVDIHSKIATSLRGSTIAEANFGSLLDHLLSIDQRAWHVTADGDKTALSAKVALPPPDNDVSRETFYFAADGFPTGYTQFAADNSILKHVEYSDRKVNVEISASTFNL